MTIEELLEEAEPGTVYKIEVLKGKKRIRVTSTDADGYEVVGTGKSLQEALDHEDEEK